ncbi:MAG: helix-turn-helix transcriptional regulator [Methylocystis silviterrae]
MRIATGEEPEDYGNTPQAELAARMGATRSAIARMENGQTLPSTKTLLRFAEATGSKFQLRLSAT